MNFTNRITSTPFFDLDAYKDIANDEQGTKSAIGVVLLAGLSCGAGLHGGSPVGALDGAVFTLVVFAAATAAAFIAAHRFDRSAWRWKKAAKCVRVLGYSLAPGIFGAAGILLGTKLAVAVMIWAIASYVYALRLAFDYEPRSVRAPIYIGVLAVGWAVAGMYGAAIRGGVGFLLLLLFVAVCIFHKAVARWLFGHADPTTKAAQADLSLRGEILLQWAETKKLFRQKGWDVTLRELVETFTLLKTRGEAPVEPPPLPVTELGKKGEDAEGACGQLQTQPPPAPEKDREEPVSDQEPAKSESVVEAKEDEASDEEPETPSAAGLEEIERAGSEVGLESSGAAPEAVVPEEDENKDVSEPPAAVGEGATDSGPDVAEVVGKIFNEDISGYESTETFRKAFQGRSVSWRGRLLQVEEFTYDTVFGGEPGVKATFEVAEIATGYGKLPVEAILRLPADELEAAQAGIGSEIAFAGELFGSDPYARKIFVKGELG